MHDSVTQGHSINLQRFPYSSRILPVLHSGFGVIFSRPRFCIWKPVKSHSCFSRASWNRINKELRKSQMEGHTSSSASSLVVSCQSSLRRSRITLGPAHSILRMKRWNRVSSIVLLWATATFLGAGRVCNCNCNSVGTPRGVRHCHREKGLEEGCEFAPVLSVAPYLVSPQVLPSWKLSCNSRVSKLRASSIPTGCRLLQILSMLTMRGRTSTYPFLSIFASGQGDDEKTSCPGVVELALVLLVTKDSGLTRCCWVVSSLLSTVMGVFTSHCRSSIKLMSTYQRPTEV